MNRKEAQEKKPKKENLKQRAYLNSVTSILDYGARVVTTFVVTPFLVSGLGSTLFGVWKTLGQFASYTSMADIKVTEVLKWAVAKDRHSVSDEELRRYLTTTFVLVMLLIPVLLMAGAVLVWLSPAITGVEKEYESIVKTTTALLILSLIINKVFGVFESILRGMNIGFKRMGFRATIFLIGGGLQILIIFLGYGLIALAGIQILVTLTIGITVYVIVKKHVTWFGFGKFEMEKSISFLKTSGWYMGWASTKMVISHSDKILLSFMAGATAVTKYVITYYLIKSIRGIIGNVVHGVLPGIGSLYGKKEYKKLAKVRGDAIFIAWCIVTCIGSIVLMFNQSFVNLWIVGDEYAGQLVNLLILITVVQYLFFKIDGAIILTTLDVKFKLLIGIISALTIIGLSYLLIDDFGIVGLCIALISGNLIMNVIFPYILYLKTDKKESYFGFPLRIVGITILFWAVSYWTGEQFIINSWSLLVVSAILALLLITISYYLLGLSKENKETISYYMKNINFMKSDK